MGGRLTREEQRQRTRQRLLDAAETLFAERGIHQTSLDDVAAEAGLTKGAVYANFDGKAGLLLAILDRRGGPYDDPDPEEPTTDHGSSVSGWLRRFGKSYEAKILTPETRRFAMAFVEFWLFGMRNRTAQTAMAHGLRTRRQAIGKEIAGRAGKQPAMPPEQLAALVLALDIGIALQHLVDPDGVPAELYRIGLRAMIDSD